MAVRVALVISISLSLLPPSLTADPLESLSQEHPRLLVGPGGWQQLEARASQDDTLAALTDALVAEAEILAEKPPLERIQQGRRLLSVSREAVRRITLWSLARHLRDDLRFARRAELEMTHIAQFADWNPSHFLDVAEMTTALALGYDWLHADLSATGKKQIHEGIVGLGLQTGLDAIDRGAWWASHENNWNQVCLGGLTLGALAVADESPEVARRILQAARQGITHGLSVYAPDGIYPEGPGYWGYGTLYQCLMIEGLRTALGTSWDLEKSPGFLASAQAQRQLAGPSGRYFNFSDGHEGRSLQPAMIWFAREADRAELFEPERSLIEDGLRTRPPHRALGNWLVATVPLWWPTQLDRGSSLPLAWHGDGHQPIAVFRSSWSDPNALYLACKGGTASASHAHMDAGSFVLEADGVRWAIDLGSQSYHSLESKGIHLWDSSQDGQRWEVFRLNNRSHNTLTLDNQLHNAEATGRFIEFDHQGATLDLSPVFEGAAEQVRRHFRFGDEEVVICDEMTGLTPGIPVRWTLLTRAHVETAGRQALLTQNGRSLRLHVEQPARIELLDRPADPPADDFNAPNPGTRLIAVETQAPADGRLRIEIRFVPERGQSAATPTEPR